MRLTRVQLRRLIREELSRTLLREAVSVENALHYADYTVEDLNAAIADLGVGDRTQVVVIDMLYGLHDGRLPLTWVNPNDTRGVPRTKEETHKKMETVTGEPLTVMLEPNDELEEERGEPDAYVLKLGGEIPRRGPDRYFFVMDVRQPKGGSTAGALSS
jgi:hypothetical protein